MLCSISNFILSTALQQRIKPLVSVVMSFLLIAAPDLEKQFMAASGYKGTHHGI